MRRHSWDLGVGFDLKQDGAVGRKRVIPGGPRVSRVYRPCRITGHPCDGGCSHARRKGYEAPRSRRPPAMMHDQGVGTPADGADFGEGLTIGRPASMQAATKARAIAAGIIPLRARRHRFTACSCGWPRRIGHSVSRKSTASKMLVKVCSRPHWSRTLTGRAHRTSTSGILLLLPCHFPSSTTYIAARLHWFKGCRSGLCQLTDLRKSQQTYYRQCPVLRKASPTQ
ncbi:hypothetical protein GGI64_001924 [Rhizobium leguminosarum]|uniref:Uncharacterized protein n=1 Tax=Rhizobium leguminosarum TaxID=384 RepID=A0A7Z0DXR7_RHILE|nr:hypothetical protein [Rhizobium leguminosarum]